MTSRELRIEHLLAQIRCFLEQYQVKYWPGYFAKLEEQLKRAYASTNGEDKREALEGIEKIFGGMGSFNDLYISSLNGHLISPAEESSVNQELLDLSSQLYQNLREEMSGLKES